MPLTGKDLLRLAEKNGWEVIRQNGSHHRLKHKVTGKKETIAVHANKDLETSKSKEKSDHNGLYRNGLSNENNTTKRK